MFGYVRPVLNKLTAEDKDRYQSAYCGLCHTMGRRHGWLARFTLNYDFTLLALLHYGSSGCNDTQCRRCPVHPFRKGRRCLCGAPLEAAADESLILTWYKLSDDVADHGLFAGFPARFLRRLLARGYRRASAARPRFDEAVRVNLERLRVLEGERSSQLDRVADTFAAILSAAAEECAWGERQRVLTQLLYHLGRWIYLVDAWDDLDQDRRAGGYNPLDARFDGNALSEKDYIETTMTHSARLAGAAADLLDFGPWSAVIENILFLGLNTVQYAVLDGRWKEMKKQGRHLNERSV